MPFPSETATTILTAAAVVLDAVAIVRAVSRDHGVERTLAWVFAILALPLVGALAYLALASPSVTRTTARKTSSAASARAALERSLGPAEVLSDEAESLFELATRATGLPPTGGNAVTFLAENERAFQRIEGALPAARERIWAEYYIVRNDATGRQFLELLTEKAREGLDVRFMYDAVGSIRLDAERLRALERAGGRAVTFLPLNPLRRHWSVHLRNHRKLVLVDDELAFTGGMNIGDEYSGRSRKGAARHFRDTHLEIRGPAVRSFTQVFAEDWSFATDELLAVAPAPDAGPPGSEAVVAALPSGPDQPHNASWLVYFSAIAAARRRVYLTSPYFVPDEPLESALTSAALRGVDVRVLIPKHSDVWLAGAASRSYCPALTAAGVRVFLYEPAMLHAKTLLVDDDLCVVGSANLDIRSFRLNFELGALLRDDAFAREVEARFVEDQAASVEWDPATAASRPFLARLADSAARLLSPLL